MTFDPDHDITGLLRALDEQCDHVLVIDNGTPSDGLSRIERAVNRTNAELLSLGRNRGIAAAQNVGIARARELGASHVLLSDHDSLPATGMVKHLLSGFDSAGHVAAVGPLPQEDREGGDQLVYVCRRWKPGRATPAELDSDRLEVAFLIASGCLVSVDALDAVGLMDESLFIDHVDLEWGLRARRAGYRLLVVPAAKLHHSLGDDVVMLPGRSQPVHVHGPTRNYYLARNTIALIRRRALMPWRWRVRYVYWLAKYVVFNALLPDRVKERRRMLRRGLWDGLRGRSGPLAAQL
ncbi:glycosyltransferase family 2 protein [Actinomyces sp. MRS3W]|uniref:glycosyltransferase family 2 protein n=1 Tax=Actinomyces sp. MRS3W TaxID=2800796 RepID=UPI0028FD90AC|nr:glycosyltransferase family 2 protein [Actinomyces sp. MRS3W]MDU0349578.1 glycosyltransferase family 2 protein [Actinomyces sp. MRS3W]